MLEQVSTFFALGAEFLKIQEERRGRVDAEAFRLWLEREAFPRLLEQSEQALQSIISLKAAEKERFDTILDHLVAIRAAVGGPTAKDVWQSLRPLDQSVLSALFAQFLDKPDAIIDGESLAAQVGTAIDAMKASVRYLDEQGWVKIREHSSGWVVGLTSAGVQSVWEADDPRGYREASTRLAACLPDSRSAKRIGDLAQEASVPYPLARVLVRDWADQGLLVFEDIYSPPEFGVVHRVSETLYRSIADE